MRSDRIDFISAYCDGWCERCGYTSRCSAFAVQGALGMCGDFRGAIELAVGALRDVRAAPPAHEAASVYAGLDDAEPSPHEHREALDQETARRARIGATPIMKNATAITMIAHRWFASSFESVRHRGDDVLAEALEIARWDSTLVPAKLARALTGRDRRHEDGDSDDDPIQNDWNGSANVALISLDRSLEAWQLIGHATGDACAEGLAAAMADLRRLVEQEFPSARLFVRPGFDEPHR